MSNRFYDNEFEKYLKEQTDQHRMYPSDQVWRNIQHEIHGYKKWPALTFISIFIISALVISTVLLKPHTQLTAAASNSNNRGNSTIEKNSTKTPGENQKNYTSHLSVENITQQTIADVIETVHSKQIAETLFVATPTEVAAEINSVTDGSTTQKPIIETSAQSRETESREPSVAVNTNAAAKEIFTPSLLLRSDLGINSSDFPKEHTYHFSFANSVNNNLLDDDLNARYSFSLNKKTTNSSSIIRLNGSSSRFDFQFYVTPSVSYRRLVDNAHGALVHSYISALPFNSNYLIDVNRVIQHKSSAGYEVGFSLGYSLTRNLALRPGLQFNMRQYNIDAYVHSSEPAAISLLTNGSNDVWNTISGFRNISGSTPIVLKNRYYEISLPLAIDWRPVNRKFAWGIAASLQPTYTFDKEPFIISSNYKNYADGSQLMRNWNINTSFETYLGYNTGRYRWQIGPQIRYQLMPTMNNSYPIREYLVDYGVKLGLIRSLK